MFGDDVPPKYVVTIADKKYEIEINYVQRKTMPDFEKMSSPDYVYGPDDFAVDTVAIYGSTLRPIDNHEPDKLERDRILRLVSQHFKGTEPHLEVVIDL